MKIPKGQRAYIIIVAILALIALVGLYGKRHSQDSSSYSIQITVPNAQSRIFLDNKRKLITSAPNQKVVLSGLDSRTYTVLVSKEGEYPWYKAVNLRDNHTISLTTFSVATALPTMTIPKSDPKYQTIKTVIDKAVLPTQNTKRTSASGTVAIWVDPATNSIHAEWIGDAARLPLYFCPLQKCSPHIIFFSAKTPIHSVDFFRNRDDVVIVSVENSISALELDLSPTQNYQPIFTGGAPHFYQPESGILFIESGGDLSVVRY